MTRLVEAWRTMEPERRFAALAALGLFVSMFLPWYQQNGIAGKNLESRNLDAFQVFSFLEAAVLLVAVALIYMLYARAEGREFHLPGGDGTVVFAAGAWVGALLIFRLFDKPGISTHGVAANVGVQWGIFFALAAAGMIAYAGSRMRAARSGVRAPRHRGTRPFRAEPEQRRAGERADPEHASPEAPEPPERGPRSDEESSPPEQTPRRHEEALPPERTPRRHEAPSPPAADTDETRVVAPGRPPAATPAGARGRPRYPPSPSEQLSFEDPPESHD